MVALSKQPQSHALIELLVDLADEIDGVVDFGVTVCLIDEEKMAGRQRYVVQHADKIRALADSIVSYVKGSTQNTSERICHSQAELVAGSFLISSGFMALLHFPRLTAETLRVATESVRGGWDAIHRSIRQLAESFGLFDEAWYASILERQDSYRSRLGQLFNWLDQAAQSETRCGVS